MVIAKNLPSTSNAESRRNTLIDELKKIDAMKKGVISAPGPKAPFINVDGDETETQTSQDSEQPPKPPMRKRPNIFGKRKPFQPRPRSTSTDSNSSQSSTSSAIHGPASRSLSSSLSTAVGRLSPSFAPLKGGKDAIEATQVIASLMGNTVRLGDKELLAKITLGDSPQKNKNIAISIADSNKPIGNPSEKSQQGSHNATETDSKENLEIEIQPSLRQLLSPKVPKGPLPLAVPVEDSGETKELPLYLPVSTNQPLPAISGDIVMPSGDGYVVYRPVSALPKNYKYSVDSKTGMVSAVLDSAGNTAVPSVLTQIPVPGTSTENRPKVKEPQVIYCGDNEPTASKSISLNKKNTANFPNIVRVPTRKDTMFKTPAVPQYVSNLKPKSTRTYLKTGLSGHVIIDVSDDGSVKLANSNDGEMRFISSQGSSATYVFVNKVDGKTYPFMVAVKEAAKKAPKEGLVSTHEKKYVKPDTVSKVPYPVSMLMVPTSSVTAEGLITSSVTAPGGNKLMSLNKCGSTGIALLELDKGKKPEDSVVPYENKYGVKLELVSGEPKQEPVTVGNDGSITVYVEDQLVGNERVLVDGVFCRRRDLCHQTVTVDLYQDKMGFFS